MSDNPIQTNRLLMEMEHSIKVLNRDVLNPDIPELTMKGLEPTLRMVAKMRSTYLQAVLELAQASSDKNPSTKQIAELRNTRVCYEELANGAKALETAIKRGYLDVAGSARAA